MPITHSCSVYNELATVLATLIIYDLVVKGG